MKAARVIAIMFNKASKLDPTKDFSDIMQNLVDVISANRKDVKFKQALMPALGEIVYLVSCQEMKLGKTIEIWTVPSLAYLLFIRSIGDDLVTNHIICKIIENVASTTSVNVKKFLSNQSELVNAVWSCYTHSANNEQLRIASLNALCMLTSHSTSIFSNLVDKVGADSVLDCLSHNNSHIQHPVLTMISMYLNDSNSKSLPEKKLISKLVSIYESTNVVCRAKAYLLTLVLLKQQNDLLSSFMQSKLIISIERDNKKNFTSKEENDYMHKIIGMLMELIIYLTTQLFDETLSLLEATYGRKNPSTTQTKQFKRCVPSMNNLKVFISNQGFRSKIVNIQFIEKFAQLIRLSKPVYESELNLDNICGGTGITADYINAIITILESIVQNIDTVGNNSRQIIKFIMPVLVENVNSQNSDIKVESLKIISELCSLYLNKQQMSQQQQQQQQQQQMAVNQPGQELKEDLKSYVETGLVDIWDQLLGQPEPIPFFTLNIFQCTLSYDITLINVLKVKNKLPSLVKYLQTNRTKIGSNVMVKLLNIFYLWSSTVDPFDLYENAIVEVLRSILIDLSKIKKYDDRIVSETLIEVLKIVDNLLKHVSEFVKKALQMKKLAGSSDGMAQQAEKLLHSNKPLIVCNQFMITLLISEDNDISELSCKILWVIMQLFGTESKDLITQENLNIFLNAIMNSNSKRQKILLRVLKRMITADKQNLEIFKSIGASFIENMKLLKNTANSEANVALATTIDEILKLI